jgi:endo-1,4-beta-mannosidase
MLNLRMLLRSMMMLLGLLLVSMNLAFVQAPPPLEICTEDQLQFSELPLYQPSTASGFATIANGQFAINDAPYVVRGVNYFPSRYPWRRFLTETERDTLQGEFAFLQEAGFNTLRIFVWYDALFDCPGSGAIPQAENFQRLDAVIQEAAAHNLRLIVTLHDLPDLTDTPLYDDPHHVRLQTALVVSRYRDEPAILAWDLRNEGDIDYGSRTNLIGGVVGRDQVLTWLASASAWVRGLDNNHLITAGWLFDSLATEPYVDFLSFHHWEDAEGMQSRIDEMRAQTGKPILLEEFGYSSFNVSEGEQAQNIGAIIDIAESSNLLGWMVWTAFDFPLEATCWPQPCVDADNHEHHFGLWRTDYTTKPAAQVVVSKLQTLE